MAWNPKRGVNRTREPKDGPFDRLTETAGS
jgi:hypothetical protein